MIDEEKTSIEFGYSFSTARYKDYLRCQCDYCGGFFLRTKHKIIQSHKTIKKDACKLCRTEKSKEVSLLRYGVEFAAQTDEFQEKIKQNNIKTYGVPHRFQSSEFKKKSKETVLARYNVDNINQLPEIKEKKKNTCLNKYGTSHHLKSDLIKKKVKETNNLRYGGNSPINCEQVKDKIKQSMLQQHGVEYYTQSPDFQNKTKATCLDKYGTEHSSQNAQVKQKMADTNILKYGHTNAACSEEIKDKIKKTNTIKYGSESYLNSEAYKQWSIEKYGVNIPSKSDNVWKKGIDTKIAKYGCVNNGNLFGKEQKNIQDFLLELGFDFQSNIDILSGREIDLYNDQLKLGIEYCGLFWHNEESPAKRGKEYHFNKYIDCCRKDVRLITIFEDEWNFKRKQVKNYIRSCLNKNEMRIFARKCQCVEVTSKIANRFYDDFHIQGSSKNKVSFGLFYNNEIVGCLSLGNHHRKKQDKQIVLNRLCFKDNMTVVGGSKRLFKHCLLWCKKNDYSNVISWSDNRWTAGDVYRHLGFLDQEHLPPDYSYVLSKRPTERFSKQSQKKSNSKCPPNMTEKTWAKERGLARIWDCGKIRWVFNICELDKYT